jgi:hypothetical protein
MLAEMRSLTTEVKTKKKSASSESKSVPFIVRSRLPLPENRDYHPKKKKKQTVQPGNAFEDTGFGIKLSRL